ncbi:hypothetical protein Agabi119p4_5237 [Agaricus bisporus var. burnettii]|uniref:HAT C-terminal dimerisation domain-containing protein n=2 Tax=Agaricus bisporus var. burnettii TaxID=192524 RepID=A0A8H7F548_AGABI|nr:hypothetical protein Agabi119p4_5237 [Agaricus bisporus var. burnettii]
MPRDVVTRWNSTYDMLAFALEYRKPIEMLSADWELDLRKYELNPQEWKLATQLKDVLQVFKHATLFFSQSENLNISAVIPSMDHFDEKLATIIVSPHYSPSIRSAIRFGKKTLNKYYSKTDHSNIYRVAMVLDPRYKLSYFKKLDWEPEWIAEAEEMVKKVFDGYESPSSTTTTATEETDYIMLPNPQFDNTSVADTTNIFEDFLVQSWSPALQSSATTEDELKVYLSTGPVTSSDPRKPLDVIMWWREHETTYPRLSQVARDHLCIPASSVDVERIFSKARIVLSDLRNRLAVQTVRSLICVGEWIKAGLITEKDLHAWLKGFKDIEQDDKDSVKSGWDKINI